WLINRHPRSHYVTYSIPYSVCLPFPWLPPILNNYHPQFHNRSLLLSFRSLFPSLREEQIESLSNYQTMDDRYGHHHNHHHQHNYSDDSGDQPPPPYPPPSFYPPPPRPDFPSYGDYPPPPQPFSSSYDDQRPPPPPSYSSYEEHRPAYHPPEHHGSGSHYTPAPDSSVGYAHHESHVSPAAAEEERHHFRPHMPNFIESHIHSHGHQSEGGSGLDLSSKPSVKIYCKSETNHMLAIREGKVILARSDPSDLTQHWVKDEKFSTKVKDQDGFPSFALVNKATGQALKHSVGATHPVQLIAYNPDVLDESILWTIGKDLGSSYRYIRMVNNTQLVFDALDGDKKHGGVHDGTTVVLWSPGKGDNQRWHITPYCKKSSFLFHLFVSCNSLYFWSQWAISSKIKMLSSGELESMSVQRSCGYGLLYYSTSLFGAPPTLSCCCFFSNPPCNSSLRLAKSLADSTNTISQSSTFSSPFLGPVSEPGDSDSENTAKVMSFKSIKSPATISSMATGGGGSIHVLSSSSFFTPEVLVVSTSFDTLSFTFRNSSSDFSRSSLILFTSG
ncbi:hypothetical protein V2J09_018748, partial [Rumex salicifolius]